MSYCQHQIQVTNLNEELGNLMKSHLNFPTLKIIFQNNRPRNLNQNCGFLILLEVSNHRMKLVWSSKVTLFKKPFLILVSIRNFGLNSLTEITVTLLFRLLIFSYKIRPHIWLRKVLALWLISTKKRETNF